MGRLTGKVGLVTGAAQGLGAIVSKAFAREGASVILTDVNEAGLERVTDEIRTAGGSAIFCRLDVTCETEWKAAIGHVLKHYGRLDILVNNAGIGNGGNVETTTLEAFRQVMKVNVEGVFLGMKYGVEAMNRLGNGGSIINMSSDAGLNGDRELYAYGASKSALVLMTKSAALHLAQNRTRIRVNSIHPGFTKTDLLKKVADLDKARASIPMGDFGDPEVIGHAAVYLASDESGFSTGSQLVADGGVSAQ